jgi:hypothetical protein
VCATADALSIHPPPPHVSHRCPSSLPCETADDAVSETALAVVTRQAVSLGQPLTPHDVESRSESGPTWLAVTSPVSASGVQAGAHVCLAGSSSAIVRERSPLPWPRTVWARASEARCVEVVAAASATRV